MPERTHRPDAASTHHRSDRPGRHDPDSHNHDSHSHDGHHVHFDTPEMTAHAELEGEVLVGVVEQAAEILAGLIAARGLDVRRVLDLGSGPGVGTAVLARRFEAADVVAVDGAAGMLDRAAVRAAELGLADRVQVRQADLPTELSDLGPADLAWASMSMHHLGDEVAVLRQLRGLLAPGGFLAVVERGRPWRVLPNDVDLGRPGLWDRADAATAVWFAGMRAALPDAAESDPYPDMLRAAGFDLLVDRELPIDLPAPLDGPARQLARKQVAGARRHLEQAAPVAADLAAPADATALGDVVLAGATVLEDLAALDRLLDDEADDGIVRRPDALLRGSRRLYVAGC